MPVETWTDTGSDMYIGKRLLYFGRDEYVQQCRWSFETEAAAVRQPQGVGIQRFFHITRRRGDGVK